MKKKKPNFAIIGFGEIAKKRLPTIIKNFNITSIADLKLKETKRFFKNKKNIRFYSDWKKLINQENINSVLISTYHNTHYKIMKSCIKKNLNIFVEKPGGISPKETLELIKINKKKNSIVNVGYNHRLHQTFELAKNIITKKKIGKILYLRGIYGHGGRLNYNKEWRFKKNISGGGELIDKGSHLIDLSRFFIDNLKVKNHTLKNYFWKSRVEDNCFFTLSNKKQQLAFLHASSTEWKNKFIFEIFCEKGKIEIQGLGKSYGREKLTLYLMKKRMGVPTIKNFFFKNDNSLNKEIELFSKGINKKKNYLPGLFDIYCNLKIINHIYHE